MIVVYFKVRVGFEMGKTVIIAVGHFFKVFLVVALFKVLSTSGQEYEDDDNNNVAVILNREGSTQVRLNYSVWQWLWRTVD